MTDERTYPAYCLDCRGTGVVMLDDRTVKAYRDEDGKKRPVRCEHPAGRQVANPRATPEQHAAFIARIKAQFGKGAAALAPEACTSCGTVGEVADGLCNACAAAY